MRRVVFSYLSIVEVDLVVKGREHILVEVKHIELTYLSFGELGNYTGASL